MAAIDSSVASSSSASSISDAAVTAAAAVVSAPAGESGAAETAGTPPSPLLRGGIRSRVRAWIKALHHDPSAEERAMEERRQQLLDDLNRAVADAPDDMPIRQVIEQLNRHRDD